MEQMPVQAKNLSLLAKAMSILPTIQHTDPVLPLYFPGALVLFMERHGHDPKAILARTGLDQASWAAPETRISFNTVRRIVHNAQRAWDGPDLGLEFGGSLSLASLGMVGQAALASNQLGEAMETIASYLALREPLLQYNIVRNDAETRFVFEPAIDLTDIENFVTMAAFSASASYVRQLVGDWPDGITFEFRGERIPAGNHHLGKRILQQREHDCLTLSAEARSIPLTTANPISAAEAREFCDAEITRIGAAQGFGGVVRTLLESHLSNMPTEKVAAKILGHSSRSLRRRLAREDLTYRSLVQQIRLENAQKMLSETSLGVEQIAHQLGYCNVGNFCRAFKKWTGQTPLAYRHTAPAR